jgi:trigger factor
MVEVKIKEQKENEFHLEIEVDKIEVNNKLENVYNDLSFQAKIPGFRKGKVPRNILNMHLGREYFYEKTAEELIPDSYMEAIKKINIEPIEQAKIKIIQIEENKPLIFEAIVQVKPEVKLGSFDKITVSKEDIKITDSDVENEIKRIQENLAKLKIVKDRPAKEGDYLVIDSEGYIDGKVIKGSKVEKQMIQLNQRTSPEFNKQLLDCSAGQEKEIKILVPKDAEDKEMAGKEIIYQVKVMEIKEKELPKLDGDFFKTIGNYKNLDDFKKDISEKLKKQAEIFSKNNYESKLLEKVAEVCEVKVPEVLIERELDYMMTSLNDDLKARNLSLQDYYNSINTNEENIKKEYRIVAEKRIKQELVLDKIAQEENIQVTEQEIKDKINTIAQEVKQDPMKVEATLKKNNNLDGLRESIKRDKIVNFLNKKVKIINSKKEGESK